MRRVLRALCLAVAVLAVGVAAYVLLGRERCTLPRPVRWDKLTPANPDDPPTLEQLERSYSSLSGPMRGRIRQRADGTFEVSSPKDDHLAGRLSAAAAVAFLAFFLLGPSPRRPDAAETARR